MPGRFKGSFPSLVRGLVRYSNNSIGQLVLPYVEGFTRYSVTTCLHFDLYHWQTT